MLLLGWFEWAMRRAGTPTNPYKPSSGIVTEGPFRYTRNPAYLSMTMIYAGVAALRNALWAILFLPLVLYVIQREQIEREEQYMERVFGEEYLSYKAGCAAGCNRSSLRKLPSTPYVRTTQIRGKESLRQRPLSFREHPF